MTAAAAWKFFVTNSNGVTGNNDEFVAGVRYPPAVYDDSVTANIHITKKNAQKLKDEIKRVECVSRQPNNIKKELTKYAKIYTFNALQKKSEISVGLSEGKKTKKGKCK